MFYKYVGAKFVPHTVFSSLQVINCNYRLNCNLQIVFRYITTFQSPNNLAVANGTVIHPTAYLVLRLTCTETSSPEVTEGKPGDKF